LLHTLLGTFKIMAKTRTTINYDWANKELYERTEKQLLKEGWYKINWNEAGRIEDVKSNTKFFCVFEREWE